MGLPKSNDDEERFSAYVVGLTSMTGHAPGQAASRLLFRFDDALRCLASPSFSCRPTSGRPLPSHRAWIFVEKPPRERQSALSLRDPPTAPKAPRSLPQRLQLR